MPSQGQMSFELPRSIRPCDLVGERGGPLGPVIVAHRHPPPPAPRLYQLIAILWRRPVLLSKGAVRVAVGDSQPQHHLHACSVRCRHLRGSTTLHTTTMRVRRRERVARCVLRCPKNGWEKTFTSPPAVEQKKKTALWCTHLHSYCGQMYGQVGHGEGAGGKHRPPVHIKHEHFQGTTISHKNADTFKVQHHIKHNTLTQQYHTKHSTLSR